MTTSPEITFRQAELRDADVLATIRVEAMRDSLERVGRFDPMRARERFLSTFSPEHTHVIFFRQALAGLYVVKPRDDALLLDHLYVAPAHQGRGIGSVVLVRVFAEADKLGCPVRVGALRESASNRFYTRHGFVLVAQSEFDNHYVRLAGAAR